MEGLFVYNNSWKKILCQILLMFIFPAMIRAYSVSGDAITNNNDKDASVSSHINIIPKPVLVRSEPGYFNLTSDVRIIATAENPEINVIANRLSKQIENNIGLKLKVSSSVTNKDKTIRLILTNEQNTSIGKEGYVIEIKSSGIDISANKPAGIYYGVQSFIQLLPVEIKNNTGESRTSIPCVYIMDYPRFVWRGLLLDVAHHFFEKEYVMKFIDQMSKYKYNILQLHMTNDNGWRIEIKEFPNLNRTGSWRVPRTGIWGSFEQPQAGEKATDGGYYTQDDIKELVRYAQERYVTIVPGIEVPGHSLAMIASYPSLSCTGLQYDINPGSPRSKEVPYAVCPGNESVFEMLDKILTEYASLFPGEYIHIGGDEVSKDFWKNCPKCQKRMADENLKDVEELQSYFIKRIEKILNSKGKKLMGWDEILEGGLAPGASVMSWRGMEGGIKAARMKHHVVMSPTQYCYFDYKQTDPKIVPEPINWGLLRLSQVYKFEPVPDNVDPQYILGGQGNVWSEHIPTCRQNDYMTWPRAMALAEVLWSPKVERDIDEFIPRLEAQFPSFDRDQVNYAKSIYDPIITPVRTQDGLMQIIFSSEVKGLDVYYTFNGTIPDNFSLKYKQQPVNIPKGATQVWAITYRNGKPVGKLLVITIEELQRRSPKS
ncbi:MAG: family 20 glycosylhydrolase [Bacteroidales bacterium]|nr:family 20 glycosylhydrolase [Bacteroidales bacterium]